MTRKGWLPITDLKPARGSKPYHQLQFPDGVTAFVDRDWKDLFMVIMRWLINNHHLRAADCPIVRPDAPVRYVVNTEPVHQDGGDFSEWRLGGAGLYFETKDNGDRLVENAIVIIRHVCPHLLTQFKFR